ncbi:DUF2637 domain-containing protein [Streptomyces sp. NBC_01373]|uniref:DUF2637 domain-containing protein n=1 Tax=Streptomyces sp. NBC_01373 TaxID=2903843 RepID=UPI002253C988|nr:DUF2637 domain-containing protein [Streptomyces sp. NBC_01373]MCX4703889.1 DUF2637 domain-containing protein [Streptomyces sp. NBC_01373]
MKTRNDDRLELTPLQRKLSIVVTAGAVVIAGIGFAGSYAAVRELAIKKGFGTFAYAFPVGIDAGIVVLLALDLLLTWIRIPFPLLRQTAWLLTAATIAFNGAAAWPDPLGVGMHAVIPILFVVSVEAARHAIGRIADITADKHMEGVRLVRWLLSPVPTFLLWRRMRLWELRSYDQVIALEQSRLVEKARLRARYGRGWRRKAPVSAVMALRLTRYGRSLAPVSGVLDIEHELPGSAPPAPELPPAQPAVSPEPEPAEPEPVDYETTVTTALTLTSSEPHTVLVDPLCPPAAALPAPSDQPVSREPVLSPAEPLTVSRPEPRPEPDREPSEPEPGEQEQQITELATRLRQGERLTKTTAAQLLGVSPATAGRRLKEAKGRIEEGTGFYP